MIHVNKNFIRIYKNTNINIYFYKTVKINAYKKEPIVKKATERLVYKNITYL